MIFSLAPRTLTGSGTFSIGGDLKYPLPLPNGVASMGSEKSTGSSWTPEPPSKHSEHRPEDATGGVSILLVTPISGEL